MNKIPKHDAAFYLACERSSELTKYVDSMCGNSTNFCPIRMLVVTPSESKPKPEFDVNFRSSSMNTRLQAVFSTQTFTNLPKVLGNDWSVVFSAYQRESPASFLGRADTVLIISPYINENKFGAEKDVKALLEMFPNSSIYLAAGHKMENASHDSLYEYDVREYLNATLAATLNTRGTLLVYVVGHSVAKEGQIPYLIHGSNEEKEENFIHIDKMFEIISILCMKKREPTNTMQVNTQTLLHSRQPPQGRSFLAPVLVSAFLVTCNGNRFQKADLIKYTVEHGTKRPLEGSKPVEDSGCYILPSRPSLPTAIQPMTEVVQNVRRVLDDQNVRRVLTPYSNMLNQVQWDWRSTFGYVFVGVLFGVLTVCPKSDFLFKFIYILSLTLLTCVTVVPFVFYHHQKSLIFTTFFIAATIGYAQLGSNCAERLRFSYVQNQLLSESAIKLHNLNSDEYDKFFNYVVRQESTLVSIITANSTDRDREVRYVYKPVESPSECDIGGNLVPESDFLDLKTTTGRMFVTCNPQVFQEIAPPVETIRGDLKWILLDTYEYPAGNIFSEVWKVNSIIKNSDEWDQQLKHTSATLSDIEEYTFISYVVQIIDIVNQSVAGTVKWFLSLFFKV